MGGNKRGGKGGRKNRQKNNNNGTSNKNNSNGNGQNKTTNSNGSRNHRKGMDPDASSNSSNNAPITRDTKRQQSTNPQDDNNRRRGSDPDASSSNPTTNDSHRRAEKGKRQHQPTGTYDPLSIFTKNKDNNNKTKKNASFADPPSTSNNNLQSSFNSSSSSSRGQQQRDNQYNHNHHQPSSSSNRSNQRRSSLEPSDEESSSEEEEQDHHHRYNGRGASEEEQDDHHDRGSRNHQRRGNESHRRRDEDDYYDDDDDDDDNDEDDDDNDYRSNDRHRNNNDRKLSMQYSYSTDDEDDYEQRHRDEMKKELGREIEDAEAEYHRQRRIRKEEMYRDYHAGEAYDYDHREKKARRRYSDHDDDEERRGGDARYRQRDDDEEGEEDDDRSEEDDDDDKHHERPNSDITETESEEEEEEEEDEEAPLVLFGTNDFNTATDTPSNIHRKGDAYGVDYILERAKRIERERQARAAVFENERRDRHREEQDSKWWWQREEDEYYYGKDEDEFDDIDFDDYRRNHHRSCCLRGKFGRLTNVTLAFAAAFIVVLLFFEKDNLSKKLHKSKSSMYDGASSANNMGMVPSSRWGNRFDDDDRVGDGGDDTVIMADGRTDESVPRYHKHSHNRSQPLTPEQKAMELEKWEDYELEVANVLADGRSDWDIHEKGGGYRDFTEDRSIGDNNETTATMEDSYAEHWIQYFDKSSEKYYYYHRETNASQWEKPALGQGVVLLGISYSTGREYVIEEGKAPVVASAVAAPAGEAGGDEMFMEEEEEDDDPNFDKEGILQQYQRSYWRWNHPYRIEERTEAGGGVDAPVFWRVPLSGATTIEEAMVKCFHLIVAGTTGTTQDGAKVLQKNVTDHLSVITLDDGSHYLNIDTSTKDGIEKAKHAGLGRSGVADVIITRYLYNAAELFKESSHTGRCFTLLRHPVERAIAVFHNLKRKKNKAVADMGMEEYAESPVAEDNWMTRMLTNTMEGKVTKQHLAVAKEVIGRKCLIGLLSNMHESMERFSKFFVWEQIHSVNIRHHQEEGHNLEEKRKCFQKKATQGVNRHQYAKIAPNSTIWNAFKKKNYYDLQLYEYAVVLYSKQKVVYERR
eukprot:CAMPEP_0183748716 /NCGR_PEP_ID=MMETSP0737-20130205/67914_1 /TAXON_ID=385413 /ORGANISM="Thalassiosira miniscula, Strain CCMP1093" /LENGTH=1088 /DNA_ID=CAMNT_0025984455 /DNA_START=208 /DNA_END=3474 /DNA_ORIENTATION=-